MSRFVVTLTNLKTNEKITLEEWSTSEAAQQSRKNWRTALGGKKCWTIDRRPGLDSCSTLVLTVEKWV